MMSKVLRSAHWMRIASVCVLTLVAGAGGREDQSRIKEDKGVRRRVSALPGVLVWNESLNGEERLRRDGRGAANGPGMRASTAYRYKKEEEEEGRTTRDERTRARTKTQRTA